MSEQDEVVEETAVVATEREMPNIGNGLELLKGMLEKAKKDTDPAGFDVSQGSIITLVCN